MHDLPCISIKNYLIAISDLKTDGREEMKKGQKKKDFPINSGLRSIR